MFTSPIGLLGVALFIALVIWMGTAIQRYNRSLIKPIGKERNEWLREALHVAEQAERLINPDVWLHSRSPKLTPEVRKAYIASLYHHMSDYLRNERVSITFSKEVVLLLLAERDMGDEEPAEETESRPIRRLN